MSRLKTTLAGALVAVVGLAGTALAEPGFVTSGVTLRAGPGPDYPPIAYLRRGTPAEVYGCLDAFEWCDVDADGQRGWMRGSRLDISYGGREVLLPYYAPRIGLPIVTFRLDEYWGRYYGNRPFFGDRDRWRGPAYRDHPPGYAHPDARPFDHPPGYAHPDARPFDHRPGGPELRLPIPRPDIRPGGERGDDGQRHVGPGGFPPAPFRPQGGMPDRRQDHPGYRPDAPADRAPPAHESFVHEPPAHEPPPRDAAPREPMPDRHVPPPAPPPAPPMAHPAPGPQRPPAAGAPDHGGKKHDQPGG